MTEKTLRDRQWLMSRFVAHLGASEASSVTCRAFLSSHGDCRPVSVNSYFRILRAFFNWCVEGRLMEKSPLTGVKAPIARTDQKHPLNESQVQQLLLGARAGFYPERDEAIVTMLVDIGLRADELCGLIWGQIDLHGRRITLSGKGNRIRTVFFGSATHKALIKHLREECQGHEPNQRDYVFVSERGGNGQRITVSGLGQLIRRIAKRAQFPVGVPVGPHQLRHTFAVQFLRNGGNIFALREMLGHVSLDMTQRYLRLANADIEVQARHASPADRIMRISRR
jgi:hypothetical protein